MKYYLKIIESPVGKLSLVANETNLVGVLWKGEEKEWFSGCVDGGKHSVLRAAERQLREYFKGERKTFDLPLEFDRGTEFQRSVWKALRTIPYGRTESYAAIAKRVGSPKACRAVGAANGRNPISIIVPCHRVIGANGNLTGFGGGLGNKQILLELEGHLS